MNIHVYIYTYTYIYIYYTCLHCMNLNMETTIGYTIADSIFVSNCAPQEDCQWQIQRLPNNGPIPQDIANIANKKPTTIEFKLYFYVLKLAGQRVLYRRMRWLCPVDILAGGWAHFCLSRSRWRKITKWVWWKVHVLPLASLLRAKH